MLKLKQWRSETFGRDLWPPGADVKFAALPINVCCFLIVRGIDDLICVGFVWEMLRCNFTYSTSVHRLELGASYTIVRGRTFDCFKIIKASTRV